MIRIKINWETNACKYDLRCQGAIVIDGEFVGLQPVDSVQPCDS